MKPDLVTGLGTSFGSLIGLSPASSPEARGAVTAGPDPVRASPQGFFDNKVRAFWNLQILGWVGALSLRGISGFANGQPAEYLVQTAISTITGFSLTLILSVVFRALIDRRPLLTWTASITALFAAGMLYAFIDSWVVLNLRGPSPDSSFTALFIGALYLDLMLLSAWAALYYAINYFLRVEEQADQLQVLEAQATSAQLAMLRYQLNPHFLFNTLNSISTLVLLRQVEAANAMLSRLSAFLRYTLANEPTAQVTLAQEVETLKLYLEIEKMRFEERLRPHFDIDPAVADVRLPSLLLQPLVENAIKYAVTPKEEGADILISAQAAGRMVQINVTDTGPGANPQEPRPHLSTGVGLANIRDRLAQAYGENQSFETRSTPGGGFSVTLELPFVTHDLTEQKASLTA